MKAVLATTTPTFLKLHKDHGVTDDLCFMALLKFDGCARIFRCETFTGTPIFHYLMPEEDVKLIRAEYDAPDGHLIGIRQFCDAVKECTEIVKAANEKGGAFQIFIPKRETSV